MVRLPATNPAQKLTFLLFTSAKGKESPLPFWGPSQSFGFSLPPLPVSGDVRLLSTNTCWYPLCDPHSLLTVTFMTGFHCSFQREDSINLTSIVSAGYRVTVSYKGNCFGLYLFSEIYDAELSWRNFLVLLGYCFLIFSFILICLIVFAPNIPNYCNFISLQAFWFFLDLVVLFLPLYHFSHFS